MQRLWKTVKPVKYMNEGGGEKKLLKLSKFALSKIVLLRQIDGSSNLTNGCKVSL